MNLVSVVVFDVGGNEMGHKARQGQTTVLSASPIAEMVIRELIVCPWVGVLSFL